LLCAYAIAGVSGVASVVSGDGTNVCTTLPGTALEGTPVYRVVAGQIYNYEASGCISFGGGTSDPDGNQYLNTCTMFTGGPAKGDSSYVCPGLISYSLVSKVGGTCIQLGSTGSFVAPATGTLVLYCNDQAYPFFFYDNSGFWDFCLIAPPPEPPAAPTDLIATAISSSEIDLNWQNNSSDEDGFELQRSTNSDFMAATLITVGPGVQRYFDSGLTPLVTYFYRIRAYNSAGYTDYSNIATATTFHVTNSWIPACGGYWDDFRKWSLSVRPDRSQVVFLTNTTTELGRCPDLPDRTPRLSAPAEHNRLLPSEVRALQKLVIVDAYTAGIYPDSMTINSLTLAADADMTNTLFLSNAGTSIPLSIQDFLMIASGAQLLVTNSSLQVGGYTAIGFSGSGRAALSKGALQAGDDRALANGVFVGLASGSQGTLSISGGIYIGLGHLCLGQEAGSTGVVWVTGGQLVTSNNYLTTVGGDGVGQFVISNGQVAASSMIVATGPGSLGKLIIAGGSASLSGGLVIGDGVSASGIVSVTSGQLIVTNQAMVVGSYGVGQLTVSNGTLLAQSVNVGIGGFISNYTGSAGLLTIAGGTTLVASNITVGVFSNSTGAIEVTGGDLSVTNQPASGELAIGQIGHGTFTQSGGVVTVDSFVATNGTNSVFTFLSGAFNTKSTTVSNTQTFIVGDGIGAATYHLLGGVHSFADGLRIRSNSLLSGCGTIVGSVLVDPGGTVLTDCGSTLTFIGVVTNNGTLKAINGSVLESYGPVVNNGVIDISGGHTNFHSGLVNDGVVLAVDNSARIDANVSINFATSRRFTHVAMFTSDFVNQSFTPLSTFTGPRGMTNLTDSEAAAPGQQLCRDQLQVPP
jgi:hypothetical protein